MDLAIRKGLFAHTGLDLETGGRTQGGAYRGSIIYSIYDMEGGA